MRVFTKHPVKLIKFIGHALNCSGQNLNHGNIFRQNPNPKPLQTQSNLFENAVSWKSQTLIFLGQSKTSRKCRFELRLHVNSPISIKVSRQNDAKTMSIKAENYGLCIPCICVKSCKTPISQKLVFKPFVMGGHSC